MNDAQFESSPRDPAATPTPVTRESVAEFVRTNQHLIRSLAREKLTKVTRSVEDSEDVLSSVFRRMDAMVHQGRVRPRSESELWALVRQMTQNTACTKTRLEERHIEMVGEDGEYAEMVLRRMKACDSDEEAALIIHRLAMKIQDSVDRQLFFLRSRGVTHRAAAQLLGISADAARKRWERTRESLRAKMDEDDGC
jgi:DNA-directed RNA polymerase specialized sigma24 family protein